jgi:hypothetical protein
LANTTFFKTSGKLKLEKKSIFASPVILKINYIGSVKVIKESIKQGGIMTVFLAFNLGKIDLISAVYLPINEQRKITFNNERTKMRVMILPWGIKKAQKRLGF